MKVHAKEHMLGKSCTWQKHRGGVLFTLIIGRSRALRRGGSVLNSLFR